MPKLKAQKEPNEPNVEDVFRVDGRVKVGEDDDNDGIVVMAQVAEETIRASSQSPTDYSVSCGTTVQYKQPSEETIFWDTSGIPHRLIPRYGCTLNPYSIVDLSRRVLDITTLSMTHS